MSATSAPTAVNAVAAFVEATTDALATAGADEATVTEVATAGDAVVTAVEDLAKAQEPPETDTARDSTAAAPNRADNSDTADRAEATSVGGDTTATIADRLETVETDVATLAAELTEAREQHARAAAEDRQRIHELECRLEDGSSEPAGDTETGADTAAAPEPQTPLEEIVALPEGVAAESLSANQRRARAVAADIHQYSRSVPAGRAVTAGELRRVLSAREDGGPTHTQTVTRVIEMLTTLGADAVKQRSTHGNERVVVFEEALVARLAASGPDHTVVGDPQGGTTQRV